MAVDGADDPWRGWLTVVRDDAGSRYSQLADDLGLSAEAEEAFFSFDNTEWLSLAGVGRNVKSWSPTSGLISLGIYLEPQTFANTQQGIPAGDQAFVEIAARIPFRRRQGAPASYRARTAWLRDRLAETFPEDRVAVYVYPNTDPRPAASGFLVTEVDQDNDWADRAAWVSMYSGESITWRAASQLDQAARVAADLAPRWERFRALVNVARGLIAASSAIVMNRNELLGFAGEYVIWNRLGRPSQWWGRDGVVDFTDANGDHEAKSRLGEFPDDPFFTAAEIARALADTSAGRSWTLHRVNVDSRALEQLAEALEQRNRPEVAVSREGCRSRQRSRALVASSP